MHELSVALSIVESIDAFLGPYGKGNRPAVKAVHLRIGRAAGIVREALEFSWGLATEDTRAADARLVIDSVPLVVRCAACGRSEELTALTLPCPSCGAPSRELESGRELQIVAIEVSDEDAPDPDQPVNSQQE